MTDILYSDKELFELGQSNYDKLISYCETLDANGFWDSARKVMQKSSTEVLDIYVQSVLMNLAVHCGNVLESQKKYICLITGTNPLGVNEGEEITDDIIADSRRMYELPPILLQLCGLYDKQNREDMTEMFLDAFLNVLLCMAYLNKGKNHKVNEFIQKYYDKISNFVMTRTSEDNDKYIKRKLTSGRIECEVEWLHEEQKKSEIKQKHITLPVESSVNNIGKSVCNEENLKKRSVDKECEKQKVKNKSKKAGKEKKNKEEPKIKDNQKYKYDEEKKKKLEEFRKRTLEHQKKEEEEQAREQFQIVKKRIQEREKAERKEHEKRIKELMEELNSLVGLNEVKEEIQSLINLIKIRKLREKMKMPTMDMTYHMVFTGSPGTGKTTVARIVGKIYKELGILSDGKMIETDRSGLVAGYVGQTAIKVHEIVEEAMGGILFIDEAYSLVNPNVPNDFGMEAVDTLVKLMEDHRDNLVIIVAGYTEEMKTFLKSNTGLISRFNKFIDFPDYSKEELVDIMEKMAEKTGLNIEKDAKKKVMEVLDDMSDLQWENFGNARGIRNLFEKIVINQANRLVTIEEPTCEQLMTIVADDV